MSAVAQGAIPIQVIFDGDWYMLPVEDTFNSNGDEDMPTVDEAGTSFIMSQDRDYIMGLARRCGFNPMIRKEEKPE